MLRCPVITRGSPLSSSARCVTWTVKTVCERDETSFMLVDTVCRRAMPALRMFSASATEDTGRTARSFTTVAPEASSITSRLLHAGGASSPKPGRLRAALDGRLRGPEAPPTPPAPTLGSAAIRQRSRTWSM